MRAPVPEDADAVFSVLAARDIADVGEPDYTLEDLHSEWRSGEFSLEQDTRVVELNADLVAYAVLRPTGTLAAVAPDFEGRGIGSHLLEWTERRTREQGRTHFRQWIGGGNERGRALLTGRGYEHARSYWRMERALGDDVTEVEGPAAGITLRALDVDRDARAVHAVDATAFASAPDYEPTAFEVFRVKHLEKHDVDPALSVVALDGDQIVGFLLARRWDDRRTGFVEILGVDPSHQGAGVGTALLRRAFAGFTQAGLRHAQLGVASDNPRARRLYERHGMTARFRFDTYERVEASRGGV
jgi:mycothiol synthase